ncbi:hypothetical protein B0H66DRAFT_62998 [Apodospora peruviana]|uniref:RRM domain-containing protein n=1 Tax=Apodospora peruviana TaxID=516989 RepID=A0AAE0ISN4_9PEZI|nr:hypothetical protein B0H66DRAFT_62998 [Apodospora peruviana]
MHSVRRVAFRSAVSASRAVSTKPLSAPFASQIARNVQPAKPIAITAARFFSLTARVANNETEGQDLETQVQDPEATTNAVDATQRQVSPSGEDKGYGVFIRNIVFDASDEHLVELFSKYGEVTQARLARDGRQMSKGYGFAWFKNEADRETAIKALDGSFWHGRRLQVQTKSETKTRGDRLPKAPTAQLYIGNIPYETTDGELNAIFREVDGMRDVRIAVDRTTGWPRGFAHADFEDVESATAAHDKLQGFELGDRRLIVDYALPANKSPRRGGNSYAERQRQGDGGSEQGGF